MANKFRLLTSHMNESALASPLKKQQNVLGAGPVSGFLNTVGF